MDILRLLDLVPADVYYIPIFTGIFFTFITLFKSLVVDPLIKSFEEREKLTIKRAEALDVLKAKIESLQGELSKQEASLQRELAEQKLMALKKEEELQRHALEEFKVAQTKIVMAKIGELEHSNKYAALKGHFLVSDLFSSMKEKVKESYN